MTIEFEQDIIEVLKHHKLVIDQPIHSIMISMKKGQMPNVKIDILVVELPKSV